MVLRKLKRLLGLGSSRSSSQRNGRDVTFQDDRTDHEEDADRSTAAESTAETSTTEPESTADDEDAADGADDTEAEPVVSGTDADASTESLVDEAEATEEATTAAEPGEAAGPASEEVTTDADEEPGESEEFEYDEPDAAGATPVDDVKGIGPAYSERLADVGIETAEDLASADPGDVADQINVPEKTVRKWVDRADDE